MISSATLADPLISNTFDLNAAEMGFVIQAHLLGAVMFLIPAAKLGDRFGHIRIFSLGSILFAATSFICAISLSGIEIIFFRLLQGIGDGMMTATALVLLTRTYNENQRGKAIGFFLFSGYFGYITGLVGGTISADIFGWQAVFLIPAPFALLAGFLAVKSEKTFVSENNLQKANFDTFGMLLFCPAIFLITAGISGFLPAFRILFLFLGAAIFFVFIIVENFSENPLFMLSLFRENRVFSFSICADLVYYMTIGCIAYTLSIYLENGLYYSAFAVGILLIPASVMQGLLSPVAGHLSDRVEPRYITALGMAIIVATLLFYANIPKTGADPALISLMLALTGTGYALFSSPNKNAVMSSVKKEYQGSASGIASTFEQMGNITSISIAAMIITMFAGNLQITADKLPQLMDGMQTVFLIMALLG
ncbi:MAG: MFS transporter, partial [Methanomicrobium sp.]|nr:MFS transporter [Methanomicrobium sp.]